MAPSAVPSANRYSTLQTMKPCLRNLLKKLDMLAFNAAGLLSIHPPP